MQKLSSQDAGFLKIESAQCPFHVAGLMILKLPERARANYLRRLAGKFGRLNELWPVFDQQLRDPENLANAAWVQATDYRPERHVFHYALPQPGRMNDLLNLVTRAHEQPLDRAKPLWELHVIEGLSGDRFAVYCKIHHALVDGVGAMKMLQSLCSVSPTEALDLNRAGAASERPAQHHSLFEELGKVTRGLLQQYRAIPQLSGLLAHMGAEALQGKTDVMRLPFTAPRSSFNTELDSRRNITVCDLSFNSVRSTARQAGGSINDVLLAVCGGALRRYLLEHGKLPRGSLVAGMPVSLKSPEAAAGNQLSYILSPFFTDEKNDLKRLRRVIKVTKGAKSDLGKLSVTASQDYYALIMAPTILLTATGNATRLRPVINAIFSNVPGSREKLYLDGAELQALYPLSIVTHGMGLNITVVSHVNKLCFAIVSCPAGESAMGVFGELLRESYRDLRQALRAA